MHKCVHDVLEHDHVYPHCGLLTEEENEVPPTEEDAQSAQLPAPARDTVEVEIGDKDDRGDVEKGFKVVDGRKEVVNPVMHHLRCQITIKTRL